MADRRWDGDERGEGIADAAAFAPGAAELLDAMSSSRWIAEEPEAHLLPHLRRSCESLPLEVRGARSTSDGTFEVELGWTGSERRQADVRAAVFAVVGSFAELSTYVRQRTAGSSIVFEVVTGFVVGEGAFAPHGHTVRLTVAA